MIFVNKVGSNLNCILVVLPNFYLVTWVGIANISMVNILFLLHIKSLPKKDEGRELFVFNVFDDAQFNKFLDFTNFHIQYPKIAHFSKWKSYFTFGANFANRILLFQRSRYPKSIAFIVSNEFCERFSFYGMKSKLKTFKLLLPDTFTNSSTFNLQQFLYCT